MIYFDITSISRLSNQVKNEYHSHFDQIPQLKQFTEQHRLTDCLDWLESLTGLDSEASLTVLQMIEGGKH